MVTYLPISSPFIRFAGRYVDEALGVAAGYNFFIFEAALVPFEIVAVSLIVNYWTSVIPVAAMNVIVLVLYMYEQNPPSTIHNHKQSQIIIPFTFTPILTPPPEP